MLTGLQEPQHSGVPYVIAFSIIVAAFTIGYSIESGAKKIAEALTYRRR